MKKQIFVNAGPSETRVALVEGGVLAEIHFERPEDRRIVGNVYRARVQRVLPGMQAAFVDIGLGKAAFLHGSDVWADDVADPEEADAAPDAVEPPASGRPPIETMLQQGQEVLVQVSKESIGSKGPRVTTQISLAGRYLVYLPTVRRIGVSRRISDDAERKRLRDIVEAHRPESGGFIVRTLCEGLSEDEITADVEYLTRLWERVHARVERSKVPSLIHEDLDLVQKTIRDSFGPDVGSIVVDSPSLRDQIDALVDDLAPRLRGRIELHDEQAALFEKHGIENEISRALDRRVRLPSGGTLVIDQTEALTAVDVNTGRYVGKQDQEETILKTNLEAAEEIVRQLRLRQIGGIIILDFIDMEPSAHRAQVFDVLEAAIRDKDKAQTRILEISELGLVEMTRQRTGESLRQRLTVPCPHCGGVGTKKSPETVALEVLRRVDREAGKKRGGTRGIRIEAAPEVCRYLNSRESGVLDEIEATTGLAVSLLANDRTDLETFRVHLTDRSKNR